MKTQTILLSFTMLVFAFPKVHSQIVIDNNPNITAEQLVENIAGEGVQVSNASFEGVTWARGMFTNGASTNLGIDNGILLTNGDAQLFTGPNNASSAGQGNGLTGWWPGFPPNTFDPSLLSFDITPLGDTLKLTYVFGSEEYNEWVNASFTDQFRLFITGPDPQGGNYNLHNMALVPGTDIDVSINTVNNGNAAAGTVPTGPCTNCEFFNDNTGGLSLQYDAFTTKLTAWVSVVPCETYSMYLAVWDAGDFIYDSGIAIEEGSLSSNAPAITTEVLLDPPGLTENMVEGHVNATVVFRLPDTSYAPVDVCFEIEGTAINGSDYEEIDNCVSFEEGQDSVSFQVVPLFDGYIEGDETIVLIIEDTLGCETAYDTLELTIEDYITLIDIISPPTITCQGCEVTLWVQVFNGYPPYTYLWEPGGFTTDTIIVAPDTTTKYFATYSDLLGESGLDSTKVTVFPTTQFSSFSFEAALNPGLPYDVIGEFSNDTINMHLPGGTNLQNLIASYTFTGDYIYLTANGEPQEPGITPNDFTNPVIYVIIGPGGMVSQWVVIADIETRKTENYAQEISIFPNPAKNQITFLNANDWNFVLLNTIGKPVLEGTISNQHHPINISGLKPGIYLMKFQKEDGVFVKRVVICR
jgi:hypothetical protein